MPSISCFKQWKAVVAKNLPPSIRVEGDDGRWWPEVKILKTNAGLWGFGMEEAVVAQWSDLNLAFRVIIAARKVSWVDKFHPSISWFKYALVIMVASNGPVSRGWWCSALRFSKGGRWWVVVVVIVANQNTKPQKWAWMLVFGVSRVVGGA